MQKTPTEQITGAKVGYFEKDADLVYIFMCELAAKSAGIADGNYLPEMRMTDHDLYWGDDVVAGIQAEDREVIATGMPSRSHAIVRHPEGRWQTILVYKTRTESGGVRGETVMAPYRGWGPNWAERLDFDKRRLHLKDDKYLTQADMTLLRMYVNDVPRSAMADMLCVSIKTVEKRLTAVKGKVSSVSDSCYCHSMMGCLHELGLTEFLLAHHDWFGATGVHKVQK